ncbi:MAG: hypothetical protein PHN75_01360 [Syntrophales bacterium]|nr:hypothetical protein [Syntrophales bacterium]
MPSHNKANIHSERGFALVTAIIACVVLFALAMLVIQFSTGDLRVSARSVGDKKASLSAETGIQNLMLNFDPSSPAAASNVQVDSANDPGSIYSYTAPSVPASGPASLPLTGYSIGGGQSWGQTRFESTVTGQNTRYGTSVQIGIGLGYGPVEITTMSR